MGCVVPANVSFVRGLRPISPRQRLIFPNGSEIIGPASAGNSNIVTRASCRPSLTTNSALRMPWAGTDFQDGARVNLGTLLGAAAFAASGFAGDAVPSIGGCPSGSPVTGPAGGVVGELGVASIGGWPTGRPSEESFFVPGAP